MPCPDQSFSYVFGVGAESRRTPTVFPPGFGYKVESGTVWGANIHLLHTEDIVGGEQGVKECIECWATPYRVSQGHGCDPQYGNGSFSCCGSGGGGGNCAVNTPDPVPTQYAMSLVVEYVRDTTVVAVNPSTFRVPQCDYEYNVGDDHTLRIGDVNVVEESWVIPERLEAVFGVAHMHTGAINVSVSVQKAGSSTFESVCTSYPVYGQNGTTVGDEAGHVVQVTVCLSSDGNDGGIPPGLRGGFRNSSLILEKGDSLKVQGYYSMSDTDPRIAPVPAGPHLGVMSYFYAAFAGGDGKRIPLASM